MNFLNRLFTSIFHTSPQIRKRFITMIIVLAGFNGIVWVFVLLASRSYPLLLGLAVLSYGFGLRHAVDADHIAAIDSTTRKLMQDGKRPVAVGFFFSLGHSVVVIVLSMLVAVSVSFVQHNLPFFKETGSLIGTSVSAVFLLIIGVINLIVLLEVINTWRKVVNGKKQVHEKKLDEFLDNRGLLTGLLKPLLKLVNNSWNMFLIGLLFGLGFDTASEIGLLSISAITATKGIPVWYIVLLPLVFTAGMTLVDTLDGILMLGAYGWAYVKPIRKLYYNMNITFVSVFIALFIGGIEILQLFISKLHLRGNLFSYIKMLDFGNLGYVIIGIFLFSWIFSAVFYKAKGFDRL